MSEPLHGIFINVEVNDSVAGDADLAAKLAEVCPVDIFEAGDGGVRIAEENLDECVLCNLCVDAAESAGAGGGITITKLYE
jgi:NAD-dependent dihydropyrimidine dehydrogenase PreA subunit